MFFLTIPTYLEKNTRISNFFYFGPKLAEMGHFFMFRRVHLTVHVQIVSAQIVSAQFVSAQIVSAQIVSGTNCIGNNLYREHIVSGTNCIGEQIVSGTNCIGYNLYRAQIVSAPFHFFILSFYS